MQIESPLREYFIKFKGTKIGKKDLETTPVLVEASTAFEALKKVSETHDIQELIDIKKL